MGELESPLHIRFEDLKGHYTLDIEDLKVMVIEKIHRDYSEYRKRKESHWIEMIRSLTPDGLNLSP